MGISPRSTKHSPRYSARVPIVTARDDRPSFVTSRPLTSPHRDPVASPATTAIGIESVASYVMPMTADASVSEEATDRSMSRTMMSSAMGKAMSRTSETSEMTKLRLSPVMNSSLNIPPKRRLRTRRRTIPRSHAVNRNRCNAIMREPPLGGPRDVRCAPQQHGRR